ncbi:venom protease-like isoform X2 [Adelges cooleyi]|uniref:venom protease-like isoform X2 n=1 Tax=Adelges cooleyi TaxID=133065 RepID=UPI0021805623|nr:venom protease-like isoform X2 [Adelges cooleyi]
MLRYKIYLFLAFTVVGLVQCRQSIDRKQNEMCRAMTKSNETFTCEPIDQCQTVLRQTVEDHRVYPKICRFLRRTPIVCCPISDGRPPNGSVADQMCKEYFSKTVEGGGEIHVEHCQAKSADNGLTIVGGTAAKAAEFPHMVLLGFGEQFSSVEWSCGGSLISDRYVLSAAHCSKRGAIDPVKWALMGDHELGTSNGDGDPQIREFIMRIEHPDYKPSSLYNDIGLYLLNASVNFNTYILPACLNTRMDVTANQVTAIGWGRTDSAPTSSMLMKVSMPLVDQQECNQSYADSSGKKLDFGISPESQICAGEDGKDTCQGDSGGPLQIVDPKYKCMYSLIGVTSFGKLCGESNAPGVYTRVSHYVSWIERIVWPLSFH